MRLFTPNHVGRHANAALPVVCQGLQQVGGGLKVLRRCGLGLLGQKGLVLADIRIMGVCSPSSLRPEAACPCVRGASPAACVPLSYRPPPALSMVRWQSEWTQGPPAGPCIAGGSPQAHAVARCGEPLRDADLFVIAAGHMPRQLGAFVPRLLGGAGAGCAQFCALGHHDWAISSTTSEMGMA